MPTLNHSYVKIKLPKTVKITPVDKCDAARDVYGTTTWRNLRLQKLIDQPLCERCLAGDKITPAVDIHHKVPFGDKYNWRDYAFDYDNLMSLCERCHHEIHNELRTK